MEIFGRVLREFATFPFLSGNLTWKSMCTHKDSDHRILGDLKRNMSSSENNAKTGLTKSQRKFGELCCPK